MGTPNFACPTLQKLIADPDFEILAVYTREPQPAGRGHRLQNSPIHDLALRHKIPVFTPKTLRDTEVQKRFCDFNADAAVVVAYGLILPKEILQGVRLGCFNIHPSLLPRWRGAAPIQRTIMAGDKETAVCVIKMDEGLDSGDVVAKHDYKLSDTETYLELEKKFAEIGAEILIDALKGDMRGTKQNELGITYAKKIDKSEREIDWTKSAEEIERQIRALSPTTIINTERIKIFAAEIVDRNSKLNTPGKILDDKFSIQCGQGIIQPLTLQRQGKRAMLLAEFLLGFKSQL